MGPMSATPRLWTPAETPRSPRFSETPRTPRGYLLSPRNLPSSPRGAAAVGAWQRSTSPGRGLPYDHSGALPSLRSTPVGHTFSAGSTTPPRTPRSALEPACPPLGGTPRGQGHLDGVPTPPQYQLLTQLEQNQVMWL